MFSFNSRGIRLKNGNVEISAIASITCEKAKKNDFPCLLWRAHSSIQITSLLLALLRADNHGHNDRRAELRTGSFALFTSHTVLLKLRGEICAASAVFFCAVVRDAFL